MADTSNKESSVTKVPMIYVCGGTVSFCISVLRHTLFTCASTA